MAGGNPIRTPDDRLRVFISSTLDERHGLALSDHGRVAGAARIVAADRVAETVEPVRRQLRGRV
ncbi:hypothetical protein, partial [Asanoa sp. NPDC050611]|uniref:hypothetical protein n=1 Tax=Asanoa sp. NPDC050611 TaxID=3157098 RepID=UPI0033FE6031